MLLPWQGQSEPSFPPPCRWTPTWEPQGSLIDRWQMSVCGSPPNHLRCFLAGLDDPQDNGTLTPSPSWSSDIFWEVFLFNQASLYLPCPPYSLAAPGGGDKG